MYETIDVINAQYRTKLAMRAYRQYKKTVWQITHSSTDPIVCYYRLMQFLNAHEEAFNILDEEVSKEV